jgi:glucose-1-phosphate cytidylyltransferase
MAIEENVVRDFVEKPKGDGGWINGGFFVLEPKIFGYLSGDQDIWEQEPLRRLAQAGQLSAYRHEGFWAAMDTLRDKNYLEDLWASKRAPWKLWE